MKLAAVSSILFSLLLGSTVAAQSKSVWDWKHRAELPRLPNLRTVVMNPSEQEALRSALRSAMQNDIATIDLYSDVKRQEIPKALQKARTMLVDLDGDGINEAIVQSGTHHFCGATGNCRVWVFRKVQERWVLILDNGGFQFYRVGPVTSHGFADLVFSDSEESEGNYVYRFAYRGDRYHLTSCWLYSWYKNVASSRLDKPIVTAVKCSD